MANKEGGIESQIGRLLKTSAINDYNPAADAREQADLHRLQRLSIATTSGDTLVIVWFPTGRFVDCNGCRWETKTFLMKSKDLLATGSSVFEKWLSPEVQEQTRRRLHRDFQALADTEYVLDMTPPIVDDESASLVARLSLSDGVRQWWKSYYILQISKYLVSGHDDLCPQHIEVLLSGSDVYKGDLRVVPPFDIGELGHAKSRDIDDYCPIRHRAAILRLLTAISDRDLVLNSAARTATMAVIAQHYDCVNVVNDAALSWLMAEPNQQFVDINAEDALGIAWALELSPVARTAFRVLVVERAIEILNGKAAGNSDQRQPSIFGRPRGTVVDEQETCIQHAAQTLAQRAEDLLTQLMSDDINVCLGITHWPNHDPDLCGKLRLYMRGIVIDAMYEEENFSFDDQDYDQNRGRYVSTVNRRSTKQIYMDMTRTQRLLTCCFWRMLGEFANLDKARHIAIEVPSHYAFKLSTFKDELLTAIIRLGEQWAFPELEVNILQTGPLALGLSGEEFKYLPLWAGGLADETGAVYQSEIPDAERGVPIGPGPGFCTGETIAESDMISASAYSDDDGEAATVATGTYTDSATLGYSVGAVPSRATSTIYQESEGSGFSVGLSGLSLNLAVPSTTRDFHTSTATQTSAASHGDFDWMNNDSDDQDLSCLDDSDFDSDGTEQADIADNSERGAHGENRLDDK